MKIRITHVTVRVLDQYEWAAYLKLLPGSGCPQRYVDELRDKGESVWSDDLAETTMKAEKIMKLMKTPWGLAAREAISEVNVVRAVMGRTIIHLQGWAPRGYAERRLIFNIGGRMSWLDVPRQSARTARNRIEKAMRRA